MLFDCSAAGNYRGSDGRKEDGSSHIFTVNQVYPTKIRKGLENLEVMLSQGCAGQLPEIYDGENPSEGKGCFAQAWSVGEILRVYAAIQKIEEEQKS